MKKVKVHKRKNSENSELILFFKNQIIYFSVHILFYLISAFICLAMGIKESSIYIVSLFVFCLCGFLCGCISGLKNRKNGLLTGLVSVLPSVILVIIISCIMNGFKVGIINLIISFALMLISGVIGGIAGVNIRIKPKKRGK